MKPWLALAWISLALCPAQQGPIATFGTTVVIPGGLTGKIYPIPDCSTRLPKFEKIEPVGTIYARGVFIPLRGFSEGFPGITDRIEWFAIDFNGRIYIDDPGNYRFNLCSDDGSKLEIRLSYFQGLRFHLSLMLSVLGPDDKRFRVFNTDEFQPPSDPTNWKYGTPDVLITPGDSVRDLEPSDFLVRDAGDPGRSTTPALGNSRSISSC